MTAMKTNLDMIISLIKTKREELEQVNKVVDTLQSELKGLYAQAKAALEGTGMDLVVHTGTVVTKEEMNITDWKQLRVGDIIRVRVANHDYNDDDWDVRQVRYLEKDGVIPIQVDEELSDGSVWVYVTDDQWEFVSRP